MCDLNMKAMLKWAWSVVGIIYNVCLKTGVDTCWLIYARLICTEFLPNLRQNLTVNKIIHCRSNLLFRQNTVCDIILHILKGQYALSSFAIFEIKKIVNRIIPLYLILLILIQRHYAYMYKYR